MNLLADSPFDPPIIVFVLGVAIAIGLALYGYIAAERRRKALAEFALANGLEFASHPPGGFHARYERFSPFSDGHSRRASNLIHGRRGDIDWALFDYRFVTGSGKNRHTHHYGIVAAEVGLGLPWLSIRPENLLDRLATVVGIDDIDFESEEFSRAYYVKCADRKLAYDLIHPQMMEYLLGLPRMHWQFSGHDVLICRGQLYAPEELPGVMAAIEGFVQRVPEYVREDLGFQRPPAQHGPRPSGRTS